MQFVLPQTRNLSYDTDSYCNADWVSLTAQKGFAVPPGTLHFWPFTDPCLSVEK
jgi:hypothetical protein